MNTTQITSGQRERFQFDFATLALSFRAAAQRPRGDRQALAELVMPYATGLYRSGLRLTGNAQDAEDVQQETLLKTMARLDQFSGAQTGPRDDLHAWVSRIASQRLHRCDPAPP